MADRIPAGDNDFVSVSAFTTIINKFHDQARNAADIAVLLHGLSGIGKTEIACQVRKRFENELEKQNVVSAIFTCDSKSNLVADIRRFKDLKDLNIPALRNGDSRLEDVFSQFYKEVKSKFPDQQKFFIFDDAERPTNVVRHVDQVICTEINKPQNLSQKQLWKIIFTTQDGGEEWLSGCDHLSLQNYIHVEGFNVDEVDQFFQSVSRQSLSTSDLRELCQCLGDSPLALHVAKYELKNNQLCDDRKFIKNYLRRITDVDQQFSINNKAVAALHDSLSRLLNLSNRPAEYRDLMKMLILYDEKNLTTEMLVSCAEVIHPLNGGDNALPIANEFISEMVKRSLCELPRKSGNTYLVSFHKLVKKSMQLLSQPATVDSELESLRKALLALMRVVPKDGRMHQSHSLFGYFYNHCHAIMSEVKRLRLQGDITREKTPCIMLMCVNILMAMAYCQLACRVPSDQSVVYLDQALDMYSLLMTGRKYSQLQAPIPDEPVDRQKAETLVRTSIGSPLYDNECYAILIEEIPQYFRLTKKDLNSMFDHSSLSIEDLSNNHFTRQQLMMFKDQGKVLNTDMLRRVYPLELLAELYSLWSKAKGFHIGDEGLSERCMDCSDTALYIYQTIKRDCDVTLLAEIITRREALSLHLNTEGQERQQRQQMTLEEIADEWEVLAGFTEKAYEYGLMRTDFAKDNYHQFICEEGIADCLGRRCETAIDPDLKLGYYKRGEEMFNDLIRRSVDENLNLQTTSKTYRHFAEFLWRCDKKPKAIRAVIDAMQYLNRFLCKKAGSDGHPEQEESCGKFKPLYELLSRYCDDYCQKSGAEPVLTRDGRDANRIDYLTKFMECWKRSDRSGQAGGSNKYSVIEMLRETCGIDEEGDVVPVAPASPMD